MSKDRVACLNDWVGRNAWTGGDVSSNGEGAGRPDCDAVKALRRCLDSLTDLLIFDGDVFDVLRKNKDGKYVTASKGDNHLMNLFENILRRDLRRVMADFSYHDLDPVFKLFVDLLSKDSALKSYFHFYNTSTMEKKAFAYDAFNKFINNFREQSSGADFTKIVKNRRRAASKNSRSALNLINNLFDIHSRLLVVRVDLSYANGSIICPDNCKSAHLDLEKWLRHIRSGEKFSAFVGYIWKLEFGPSRGLHFHVMLFFDSSKARNDINLGKIAGETWINLTNKKGAYWNCNANKLYYEKRGVLGIGSISHDNAILRKNLLKSAGYLAEVDYYVALSGVVGRTFGRSELKVVVKKGGRPRKNQSAVCH